MIPIIQYLAFFSGFTLFGILGVWVGNKIVPINCPKCGGYMNHIYHTSSAEVNECIDCGYLNDSRDKKKI